MVSALICAVAAASSNAPTYDLVVYGPTSAGIAAAVQAKRMGKSVIVVGPDKHLGGLTAGGLGWTDSGNKAVVGGLAREYYQRIRAYYDKDETWRWQKPSEYSRYREGDDAQWTFEPHIAEQVFEDLVDEYEIPVVRDEWLNRAPGQGVKKDGARITSITMLSGSTFTGKMFIDATYEGDLLAAAGVSYMVGRESNSQYGETLNGIQKARAVSHQFTKPVDPYVIPGDQSSGLLPKVHGDDPGVDGEADSRLQAYNYRVTLTRVPENRVEFPKPDGYDPMQYELLLRTLVADADRTQATKTGYNALSLATIGAVLVGFLVMAMRSSKHDQEEDSTPPVKKNTSWPLFSFGSVLIVAAAIFMGWMPGMLSEKARVEFGKFDMLPNLKTDTNNSGAFSTDNIGMNYDYPEASYERRAEILKEHEDYEMGYFWFIANDPRVPKARQDWMAKWGLAKDEFTDNGNWPHQIYVREARRMVSDFVITENHLRGKIPTPRSVGMGSYNMDSHNTQRYVDEIGHARNEGDIQINPGGPYPIDYGSLIPKKLEAANLIVPVCVSCSHIAFGSIRMEPVFMVLGQSAATAASIAIDEGIAVQDVDFEMLEQKLIEDKQVLKMPGLL